MGREKDGSGLEAWVVERDRMAWDKVREEDEAMALTP